MKFENILIISVFFCLPVWAETQQTHTSDKSICYGSTHNGRLENGVSLPTAGDNFVSYHWVGKIFGRTFVHSDVAQIILGAYETLKITEPTKVFKYAETGLKNGGIFKPHKTHQNGLSVDFMTPVVNQKGESVHLPTHMFNKLGYKIEFDLNGRFEDYRIDFDAMGAHLVALHKASLKQKRNIRRVLFDPVLQPFLMKTSHGPYLSAHIKFAKKRSWVRHDEHYHVDFDVPCQ